MTEQNVNTVLELIQDQLKGLEDFLAKTTSTLHGYDGSEEVKFVQKKLFDNYSSSPNGLLTQRP